MSYLVYELTIVPMLRYLKNLDAILGKAEEYAGADEEIDENTLVQARLYPNMRPFVFQIRVVTDIAKGAAARLSGNAPPSWADNETTFAELHARLRKAIDYVSAFKPEDFAHAGEQPVTLKLGSESATFSGLDYIRNFVMPNFYFHVTTAYNILRHNGLALGKRDYTGAY